MGDPRGDQVDEVANGMAGHPGTQLARVTAGERA
jgi:hypothetical protein